MNINLNHSSVTPLYYQLREQIRTEIMDGSLVFGEILPSENQLASELKLSRATVKQAYDGLVNEGLISRKRGKGTFVSYQQSQFDIMQVPNFYEQKDTDGSHQISRILEKGYIPSTPNVAKHLGIKVGTEVVYLKRVRYIDGIASIIQTVYIRSEYAKGLLESDLASTSFHRYIEEVNGIELNFFDMIINAIILDSYECDLLEIDKPIAGFRFISTYWHDKTPVVFNERVFRGDSVRLGLKFDYDRNTYKTQYKDFGIVKEQ